MTAAVRFWAKVASVGNSCECWIWRGARNKSGYGNFHARRDAGRKVMARAHRWAYEQMIGHIPRGLHLDHLCRDRMCVNPAHLEPVTNAENTARGIRDRAVSKIQNGSHVRRGAPNASVTKRRSKNVALQAA